MIAMLRSVLHITYLEMWWSMHCCRTYSDYHRAHDLGHGLWVMVLLQRRTRSLYLWISGILSLDYVLVCLRMASHYVGHAMWSTIVYTSLVQSTRGVHISVRCLEGIPMHMTIHHLAMRMSVLHDIWSTTTSSITGVVSHL